MRFWCIVAVGWDFGVGCCCWVGFWCGLLVGFGGIVGGGWGLDSSKIELL